MATPEEIRKHVRATAEHVDEHHLGEDEVMLVHAAVNLAVLVIEEDSGDERLAHAEQLIQPFSHAIQTALTLAALYPEWVKRIVKEASYEREIGQQVKNLEYIGEVLSERYIPRLPGDDLVGPQLEGIGTEGLGEETK